MGTRLRSRCRRICGWLVAVLLYAQLATAAYACPALTAALAAAHPAQPVAMAAMPGCDGHVPQAMDSEQPALCQAHCQQDAQTAQGPPGAQATHAADGPALPLLLAVLDWSQPLRLPDALGPRAPALRSGAPPPGALPLYLSLLVLRN